MIVVWIFLWSRRRKEKFATGEHTPAEQVAAVFVIAVSMVVASMAIFVLIALLKMRHAVAVISNHGTGENTWGVGQIIAPFAWGPLLVEMIYTTNHLWGQGGDDETG